MTWNISLPMYNVSPRVANAYGTMAQEIAEAFSASTGCACAVTNARENLEALWLDEKNLLSQTCGYPLVTQLKDRVQLVATPIFSSMQDCPAGYYRSAFVVGRDSGIDNLEQCRGKRLAVNNPLSNSGVNVLNESLSALDNHRQFFRDIVYSGSHLNSMEFIAKGRADVASIDAVTLGYAAEDYPQLAMALKTIGYSIATPALPLIASTKVPSGWIKTLRTVLHSLADRIPRSMELLHIVGFTEFSLADYQKLLAFDSQAIDFGLPQGEHRIRA